MWRITSPGRERKFFSWESTMSKSLSLFWSIWLFGASTARGERDLYGNDSRAYLLADTAPKSSKQDGTYLRSIEKASDNCWILVTGTDLMPRSSNFPTRSNPRKADSSLSSRMTRVLIRCLEELYTFDDLMSRRILSWVCEFHARNILPELKMPMLSCVREVELA